MNLQQIKPGREADFQQAVLEGAHNKAKGILAAAEKKRSAALDAAYAQCEKADYTRIKAQYEKDTRRRVSAARQSARADLLRFRGQLVEELFAAVRERLSAFVGSADYGDFFQKRLAKHKGQIESADTPVVYLREADRQYADLAEKAWPGCRVEIDEGIAIGGMKVQVGNLLFDETLDADLRREREAFVMDSGLHF